VEGSQIVDCDLIMPEGEPTSIDQAALSAALVGQDPGTTHLHRCSATGKLSIGGRRPSAPRSTRTCRP